MYAAALDLLNRFGDIQLAQLGAPNDSRVTAELLRLTVEGGDRSQYSADEQAAADAALTRIDQALADAGRQIDSYLMPRYPLPLRPVLIAGANLDQVAADIARYSLMGDRATEEVEKRYDRRIAWLRDVSKGAASLGAEDTAVATPAGRPVIAAGKSRIDWGGY